MAGFIESCKNSVLGAGVSLLGLVLGRLKNKVGDDGILSSLRDDHKLTLPPVNGSFYTEIMQLTNKRLKEKGDWIWLKNGLTQDTLRASEVEVATKRLAVVFANLGLRYGECIHVIAGNHNYSFLTMFAAWYIGAYCSTGDVELDSNTIAGQLDDLQKVKLVICTPELSQKLVKAVKLSKLTYNNDTKIVCLGDAPDCLNLFDLLKSASTEDAPEPATIIEADKEKLIIFWSSGTTGKPKGICWSHQNMWNIMTFFAEEKFPAVTHISTQCFFHVGSSWGFLGGLLQGHTYYHLYGDGFSIEKVLETVKEAKPRALVLGTHHFVQISELDLTQTGLRKKDLSSVFWISPVGASVPTICKKKVKKLFPNLKLIFNGYGSSEVGVVSSGVSNANLGLIGCRIKVKIVNVDTGEICKPGELGEICINSPFMMMEYLERPDANKEIFLVDGFLRTGDLGVYDRQGLVSYVDRVKEIIKYKGNHVSPTEIENILQEHPTVKECLVFGKKDPTVQELISAVVVPKENEKVNTDELKSFVNERTKVDYKKIRGDIIIRDEIPRNSVGKLLRREMRKWAEEEEATSKQTQ